MKVPAWEFWSTEGSWGMRELDTRKLREGASIEEAYSDTVYHIDMGCHVSRSDGNDAKIVGGWLKDYAWMVSVPQLLDDFHEVQHAFDNVSAQLDIIRVAAKNNVPIIFRDLRDP